MADGRYALVVASSHYADATLTRLEAPAHDARELADVLASPGIGGFDVTTLADELASRVMQEIESFFDGRRREDLVLLYFSGHGILDEGARLYFATTDTRADRPRSTAVSASFVNDLMGECRSRRQVLVLDCCNSGAFARGLKAGGSIGTGERFEGRGRVVITASDALQYAFEGDHIEGEATGSVFTSALVGGLRSGAADLNRDGRVTLDELYDFVYGRVLDLSPRQRPHKWAFGVEGQIVIAQAAAAEEDAAPLQDAGAAAPPPPPRRAPDSASRPLLRRPLVWIVAGALLLAAVVAGTVAALASGDGSAAEETGDKGSLAAGRDVALAIFDRWQNEQLWQLDASEISASAKRALTAMPIDPVTPTPAAVDDCYGTPDEITCSFAYPGLNINLAFTVLSYSSGLRLADVRCYDANDGEPVGGGIAACAEIVRSS